MLLIKAQYATVRKNLPLKFKTQLTSRVLSGEREILQWI